jgi:hypothetical protein
MLFVAVHEVCCCAGFQPPVVTELSTHFPERRLKSAKARNRGGREGGGGAAGYGDLAAV